MAKFSTKKVQHTHAKFVAFFYIDPWSSLPYPANQPDNRDEHILLDPIPPASYKSAGVTQVLHASNVPKLWCLPLLNAKPTIAIYVGRITNFEYPRSLVDFFWFSTGIFVSIDIAN
jgi:hypothetical protein